LDPSKIGGPNATDAEPEPGVAVPMIGALGAVAGRYTDTFSVVSTCDGVSSAWSAEHVTTVAPIAKNEPDV
jgi:hypothetical protein